MLIDTLAAFLDSLGLPVTYRGRNYVATSTEFRGGNNPLGCLVYEGNVWDQVEQKSYTWNEFAAKALGVDDREASKRVRDFIKDELPLRERDDEEGAQLLPRDSRLYAKLRHEDYTLTRSYSFFLKRGIGKKTLDVFGAGLAQGGPMYGRVVFKINDFHGDLIGAVGRDVLGRDKIPKWKVKGQKREFIYPLFEPGIHQKTGQIVLVESVGDALSLWNSGIKQVLITFGLHLTPKLLSYIIRQNPERIILALNNDEDKEENRGAIAAERIESKLGKFFKSHRISMALPVLGDFGEQNREQNLVWAKKNSVVVEE